MLQRRKTPTVPAFVANRPIKTRSVARAIGTILPLLKWLERMHPGESRSLAAMQPAIGLLALATSSMLLLPVPLTNVLPALALVLLASALIKGSRALIVLSFFLSLARQP
jgi:hypothetical protein